MPNELLIDLRSANLPDSVGNKAMNLRRLQENRFPIPRTFVVPWTVYQQYQSGDLSLVERMRQALGETLDPQKLYAVRSSASVEDGSSHSFAGQFKTVLNARGTDAIFTAIWSVWATAGASGVNQYAQRKAQSPDAVRMAVIIQEMVTPVYSGVVFSRNPMTGTSETVVEAVEGVGTALVQAGCTPERWVRRQDAWAALPEGSQIPLPVAEQAVAGARRISKLLGKDVDLEWVYDGSQVVWVQMREITALKDVAVYTNRLSKDMMPGIIKPLIWSINVPLINSVWIGLMEEMVGETGLKPEDLARSFYYRSYFNMGAIGKIFNRAGFPSEGLEMMMGVIPPQEGRPAMKMSMNMKSLALLPRLLAFLIGKWNFNRRLTAELPGLQAALAAIPARPPAGLDEPALAGKVEDVYALVKSITYFNVVVPLLVTMYGRLLAQELRKLGVDPQRFHLTEGMPEIDAYNPAVHLRELNRLALALGEEQRERLRRISYAEFQALPGMQPLQQGLAGYLERFGHLSNNSNDFSATPWRETPETILRLIVDYTHRDEDPDGRVSFADLRMKGLAKQRVGLLYRRSRALIPYREKISSLYTYAYGLFRPYLLALAERMAARGLLDARDDIFYLRWEEIRAAAGGSLNGELRGLARQRRAEIERVRDIELPDVIYGDEPPPVLPAVCDRMSGTPTSRGYYTGPVRMVRGLEDFHKLEQGDVLVIPYSDVGWTPLFAKAGAVIAESGGMLSHSSIIAREYGIPAVVSVASAGRLKDGQRVCVDGYRGLVMVVENLTGEEGDHAGSTG